MATFLQLHRACTQQTLLAKHCALRTTLLGFIRRGVHSRVASTTDFDRSVGSFDAEQANALQQRASIPVHPDYSKLSGAKGDSLHALRLQLAQALDATKSHLSGLKQEGSLRPPRLGDGFSLTSTLLPAHLASRNQQCAQALLAAAHDQEQARSPDYGFWSSVGAALSSPVGVVLLEGCLRSPSDLATLCTAFRKWADPRTRPLDTIAVLAARTDPEQWSLQQAVDVLTACACSRAVTPVFLYFLAQNVLHHHVGRWLQAHGTPCMPSASGNTPQPLLNSTLQTNLKMACDKLGIQTPTLVADIAEQLMREAVCREEGDGRILIMYVQVALWLGRCASIAQYQMGGNRSRVTDVHSSYMQWLISSFGVEEKVWRTIDIEPPSTIEQQQATHARRRRDAHHAHGRKGHAVVEGAEHRQCGLKVLSLLLRALITGPPSDPQTASVMRLLSHLKGLHEARLQDNMAQLTDEELAGMQDLQVALWMYKAAVGVPQQCADYNLPALLVETAQSRKRLTSGRHKDNLSGLYAQIRIEDKAEAIESLAGNIPAAIQGELQHLLTVDQRRKFDAYMAARDIARQRSLPEPIVDHMTQEGYHLDVAIDWGSSQEVPRRLSFPPGTRGIAFLVRDRATYGTVLDKYAHWEKAIRYSLARGGLKTLPENVPYPWKAQLPSNRKGKNGLLWYDIPGHEARLLTAVEFERHGDYSFRDPNVTATVQETEFALAQAGWLLVRLSTQVWDKLSLGEYARASSSSERGHVVIRLPPEGYAAAKARLCGYIIGALKNATVKGGA